MKLSALLAAVLVAAALAACGGGDVASSASATKGVVCGTQTLASVFTTDCSTTTGLDSAVCLAGPPPVCTAGAGAGCSCTGEGTNLWAAIGAVGLCSVNAEQTRAGWQSTLCAVQVRIGVGDPRGACDRVQALESDIDSKAQPADYDIQHDDANALRKGAQAIEAAISAAGTRCRNVTKLVP